jgi:hypothetical protein
MASAGIEACRPEDGGDATLQPPGGVGRAAMGAQMETQGVARDAIEQDLQMPSNMQVGHADGSLDARSAREWKAAWSQGPTVR